MASNDEKVKVFHLNTWDCQMLKGHTDIVIGLDINYDHSLIATCSKVCLKFLIMKFDCKNYGFRMILYVFGHMMVINHHFLVLLLRKDIRVMLQQLLLLSL